MGPEEVKKNTFTVRLYTSARSYIKEYTAASKEEVRAEVHAALLYDKWIPDCRGVDVRVAAIESFKFIETDGDFQ